MGAGGVVDEANGLTLRVLGELDAIRDGVTVDLGGRRQRASLAALIIARGEAVSAERLAECVWGDDSAGPRGAGGLQSYVSHLRKRLQPDADARSRTDIIARIGRGYALRVRPTAVDAWRFEHLLHTSAELPASERVGQLRAALELWRGPAYAEYADEEWAAVEIGRLTELRAVARDRLMEARSALGEAALLVPELEALVADDPLREERWRLLVLTLYRAHRQGDALAALRRAREILATELGVEPGPALRSLERDVLLQSPALDGPSRILADAQPNPPTASPESDVVPAGPPARTSDLVERDLELAALARAVDDAGAGAGGTVLIEGSAGIGKSRLLVEAGRLATAAGLRVLSARGSEIERGFGFGIVRQLFEPDLQDPVRQAALLGGAASSARGVFDAIGDEERADGSFAALHGLYWLTVNLAADGPLLLSVDDVQWSDGASLRFLAYLARRIDGLPVLLAMTVRTGERQPTESPLAELLLDPSATVVRPQPLTAAAAETLVRGRLSEADADFVRTCHRTTSGNPLLLRQLVRALESEGVPPDVVHVDTVRAVGSRAVSSLVMLRLRRMPPTAIEVARAVALLGEDVDLPSIAALADLPEERAAEALDVLSRSEILTDFGPLRFVHPLVQDAVYGDMSGAERSLRHERAAGILRQRRAPAERVAAHILLAPARGDAETVDVLRSAARTAVDRGAPDGAIPVLRRALDEPPVGRNRVDVLVELGMIETALDAHAAVAHLTEAYGAVEDQAERARLALVIASTQALAARRGVATAFAEEAAAALPLEQLDARQGLQAVARIASYMHSLPGPAHSDGRAPEVTGDGDGAHMLAATLAFERMLAGADRSGAGELAQFAIAGDRLLRAGHMLLWVVAVDVLLVADADLRDLWQRALARAHSTGSLFAVLSVNLWHGFAQWRQGRLDDARQSVHDATEQIRMWGGTNVVDPFAASFAAGIQLDRGDVDAAANAVDEVRSAPRVGEGARQLRHATAELRLAQGRPAAALEILGPDADRSDGVNPAWTRWRYPAARALAALGRADEARALADEQVALLRRWGAPTALGSALRLAGELRGPAGVPLLRESIDRLCHTEAALELARSRLALGRLRDIDDHEAVPLLRTAASGGRDCGSATTVEAARVALADRGERPDADLPSVPRLTGRERQVLDLSAAGLELRDVAQRLFLTPGTVQQVLATATAKTRGAPTGSSPPQVPAGTVAGTAPKGTA